MNSSVVKMNPKLARSAKIKIEILEGAESLERGHEVARCLWNYVRYCCKLYSRQYRQRYKWLGLGKLKWPGKYGLDKAFRDHWAGQELSERCFTTVIKEYDVAYRSFMSKRASGQKARRPRYCKEPRQLFFEVGRNAKSLGDWKYRLTVLGGHIQNRHAIVRLHIGPGIKMKDIKIVRVQPDNSGTVVYYQEAEPEPGDHIAALDLGINNLGVLAFDMGDSILYSGRGILSSDRRYHKKEAKCKPSGWKGKGYQSSKQSKRKIAYRVKAGNIRRLAVHNFTRSIIDECVKREIGTLITGDLKGIRTGKDHGKAGNQKLHAWPFAEILRQLKYKGEEAGIEVVTVSERYTSQTCHVCGAIDKSSRVHRGLYKCKHCGAILNADVNGAFNILNKVSPALIGAGVGALLPCPPSLTEAASGTGEASQIHPTFVAKFDLRNWAVVMQDGCNRSGGDGGSDHRQR